MKKRPRTSYAFLMEMMWVCAFFLVCACIFVLAFAKAEQMSRRAEATNRSVQAASNVLEDIFTISNETARDPAQADSLESIITDFAKDAESTYSTEDYILRVSVDLSDGLVNVIVEAIDTRDESVIYTLTGSNAIILDMSSMASFHAASSAIGREAERRMA